MDEMKEIKESLEKINMETDNPIQWTSNTKKVCENCGLNERALSFNVFFNKDLCNDCDKLLTIKSRGEEPEKYLKYCGIPKEYLHCSLDNFTGNDKLIAGFRRYLKNIKSMIICGICGTGKTHIAIALIRELVKMNVELNKLEFKPTRKLLQNIKASYEDSNLRQETEESILSRYSQKKFLVLDDFGYDERPSNNQVNVLYSLLDERINEGNITILTTNLTLEEIDKNFGTRIASRLSTFLNVKIGMPDYRKKRITNGTPS